MRSGQRFCPSCGSVQSENYRNAQPAAVGSYPSHERAVDHELHGVFGWLRFFCFLITVVAPLSLFLPGRYPLAIEAIGGVVTIFGILVGANLWSVGRNALEMLKIYFFARFLLQAVLLFHRFFSIGRAESPGTALASFIGLTITVIWYLYFRTSERVKATYGKNI